MVDDGLFREFERLNAQIDVWIDEENFPDVDKTFCRDLPSEFPELSKAFGHDTCAVENQDSWARILSDPAGQQWITHVLLAPDGSSSHRERREGIPFGWGCLFLAKWIRAKIQEKGTDCYISMLDRVLAYLERHMPLVGSSPGGEGDTGNDALRRKKLLVLYILEMAAAGLGPDHRSFALRAKRFMDCELAHDRGAKDFVRFYALVADYHMAVGYFHEKQPEKGEAACMKIIRGLKHLCPDSEKLRQVEGPSQAYSETRFAQSLLYVPAVLGIAEARAKQQLAHSAIEFTKKWFNPKEPAKQKYEAARRHLIRAEARLLMDSTAECEKEMKSFLSLYGCSTDLHKIDDDRLAKNKVPVNLRSRAIPLMLEHSMQLMRQAYEKVTHDYKARDEECYKSHNFNQFSNEVHRALCGTRFFEGYWKIAENRKEDRQGFLKQLAQYLKVLVKEVSKDSWGDDHWKDKWADLQEELTQAAKELYRYKCEHKENGECEDKGECSYRGSRDPKCMDDDKWRNELLPAVMPPEPDVEYIPFRCHCKEDRKIDLDHVWADDFIDFQDTMMDFFEKANKKLEDDDLTNDEIQFVKAVREIQKGPGENLLWLDRKYGIRLSKLENAEPGFGCTQCLGLARSSAFSGLLKCAEECALYRGMKRLIGTEDTRRDLRAEDYERIMGAWDKYFEEHVSVRTSQGRSGETLHLLGLQRWNSTSPAMGLSTGGGYFIYRTSEDGDVDLGIAVDPGFNFVENLVHCGFSIADVDIVLLSHSHLDHLRDFESMVSLCFESKKRTKEKKRHRLHTVMTFGTYDRVGHLFKSPELRDFIEPYIIDIDKRLNKEFGEPLPNPKELPSFGFSQLGETLYRIAHVAWDPGFDPKGKKCGVKITPLRAFHNDHGNMSDSFGFKIEITRDGGQRHVIGYTGDTAWATEKLMDQYEECDALLVHLGSLIGSTDGKRKRFREYKKGGEECYELVIKQNHPYLPGLLHFLYDIKEVKRSHPSLPLVLISEFGEELRGRIRVDLFGSLKKACQEFVSILPVDVGLDVLLAATNNATDKKDDKPSKKSEHKVWCVQCEEYVEMERAEFETYGHDEALFCVCDTCRRATPHNVLQDRLQKLSEEGRHLQRAFGKRRLTDQQRGNPVQAVPFSTA